MLKDRDNDSEKSHLALVDRVADHRRQFAHQPFGHLPRHGKLSRPLEFLDRGLGI
jgi:hypothetical protein